MRTGINGPFAAMQDQLGSKDTCGLWRKFPSFCIVWFVLLAAVRLGAQEPYSLVNPRVGSAGVNQNDGQTSPFVGPPFSMTSWTPQTRATEDKCVAPYYDKDTRISGFRGSHWLSGSCAQDYGSVTLMPATGEIRVAPEERASEFRHQDEIMAPGYYAVDLKTYSTKVEMTATARTGLFRITFPRGSGGSLLLEPNAKAGEGYVEVQPERNTVIGYNPVHRLYQGSGESAGFRGYFVARFQKPFSGYGTWCGKDVHANSKRQDGGCGRLGAFVSFTEMGQEPLLVKVGTSFTSIEEAEKNLDAEDANWNFDAVREKAEASWKTWLGRIEIEGGSLEQKKSFYTALYHAALGPRVVSDADGTYNGFANEGKLHQLHDGEYYDDYSLWDTFRAVHPLFVLLDPSREERMVQSLILKGEQGGFLPIFPMWNSYTSAMVGDHAVPVIVDAYVKGLRHFDVQSAYRLIRQNATTTPPYPEYRLGKGRRALTSYLKYGFIPLEDGVPDAFHVKEQVSRTLEYAYDDAQVATLAKALGQDADAAQFRLRSENWRNVFDPSIGFVRGRHQDGTWSSPFEPGKAYSYITEGVPWQYTFFVPQNIPGLIQAMGGRDRFIDKLDGLFAAKLYDQSNEPSHHIAYLYDYAGAAWKTQERVREAMAQYSNAPDGLPGNDDDGQMSAWYVWSALGLYPVCPGTPEYAIGSPIFSRITIHQTNGRDFSIRAAHTSPINKYIQSLSLDGRPYGSFKLTHADIVKGGVLMLEMGDKPSSLAMR